MAKMNSFDAEMMMVMMMMCLIHTVTRGDCIKKGTHSSFCVAAVAGCHNSVSYAKVKAFSDLSEQTEHTTALLS